MIQDVNIEVMWPAAVKGIKEQMCPEPDVSCGNTSSHDKTNHCIVHIFLPPLSKLRAVKEHLRQLSDVMGVSANGNGQLRLFIETEIVRVDTKWTDCKNPPIGE